MRRIVAAWTVLLALFMWPCLEAAASPGWRTYWGGGWYSGIQKGGPFFLFEKIRADLGVYRDNGRGTVVGLATGLGFSDWIYLMDLRINAMRYSEGKPGEGMYFKSEAGITHWSVPAGRRRFRGWEGKFASIAGLGVGYEWKWRERPFPCTCRHRPPCGTLSAPTMRSINSFSIWENGDEVGQ